MKLYGRKKILRILKIFWALDLYVLVDTIVEGTEHQVAALKAGEHLPQEIGFQPHLQAISSKEHKLGIEQ